jgi:hypothetical protein
VARSWRSSSGNGTLSRSASSTERRKTLSRFHESLVGRLHEKCLCIVGEPNPQRTDVVQPLVARQLLIAPDPQCLVQLTAGSERPVSCCRAAFCGTDSA